MTDLAAHLREAADELDRAHTVLDHLHVPREADDGIPYTLAARIVKATGLTLEDAQ